MKSVGSISILHVIFLSMTVIGLKNHVTIIPPLLDAAKRDGWLSVLFAGGVIFFWLFLLVYIQKIETGTHSRLAQRKNRTSRFYYHHLYCRHFSIDYRSIYNGGNITMGK